MRATCPECRKITALRKDGALRLHRIDWDGSPCTGSGTTPVPDDGGMWVMPDGTPAIQAPLFDLAEVSGGGNGST